MTPDAIGPWALLWRSESAVQLAAAAFLLGYAAAWLLLTLTFWDRLRAPKEIARLRASLREQDEQLAALYQQINRLSLRLMTLRAKEPVA
jgi:septal ring factor EnvC (AmiA/AmiB activator)